MSPGRKKAARKLALRLAGAWVLAIIGVLVSVYVGFEIAFREVLTQHSVLAFDLAIQGAWAIPLVAFAIFISIYIGLGMKSIVSIVRGYKGQTSIALIATIPLSWVLIWASRGTDHMPGFLFAFGVAVVVSILVVLITARLAKPYLLIAPLLIAVLFSSTYPGWADKRAEAQGRKQLQKALSDFDKSNPNTNSSTPTSVSNPDVVDTSTIQTFGHQLALFNGTSVNPRTDVFPEIIDLPPTTNRSIAFSYQDGSDSTDLSFIPKGDQNYNDNCLLGGCTELGTTDLGIVYTAGQGAWKTYQNNEEILITSRTLTDQKALAYFQSLKKVTADQFAAAVVDASNHTGGDIEIRNPSDSVHSS